MAVTSGSSYARSCRLGITVATVTLKAPAGSTLRGSHGSLRSPLAFRGLPAVALSRSSTLASARRTQLVRFDPRNAAGQHTDVCAVLLNHTAILRFDKANGGYSPSLSLESRRFSTYPIPPRPATPAAAPGRRRSSVPPSSCSDCSPGAGNGSTLSAQVWW